MQRLSLRLVFLSSLVLAFSLLFSGFFFHSVSATDGQCPQGQVFLNSFTLTFTPTGSSFAIDLLPYLTPAFSPSGPQFFYVIDRGANLPTGTVAFTPTSFSAGATFRIRFNHGAYIFASVGQTVTGPVVAGTDLIEFDVVQNPCAGTDIQEYSITLYQQDPPCYHGQVFLFSFDLTITPTGSNTAINLFPHITPAYSPNGPQFFYVIDRGANLPTGTVAFTPTGFSAGATFQIRFNHGAYISATAGQTVTAPIVAGTDLIEFEVIQNHCDGTDIQEYSITLYQQGPALF